MLHICLHTLFCESLANDKLKPQAYVLGNFSGFLSQRRKKNLESTADVNSDCIHITSKRSRIMDWPRNSLTLKNLRIHLDWSVPSFPCFPYRSNYFRRASKDPKATLVTLPTLSQTAWNDVTKVTVYCLCTSPGDTLPCGVFSVVIPEIHWTHGDGTSQVVERCWKPAL